MRFIFGYLRPYAGRMSMGFALKFAGTVVELFLPTILSHIIGRVVPTGRLDMIIVWGVVMVICAFVAMFCNVIANRMASKVARDSSEAIRHDLFEKTMNLSGRQTDAFSIPSLESRLTTDTYNIHHFIGLMQRMGVRAPILLFGGLAMSLILDYRLALVMICMLPPVAVVVFLVSSKGIPMYRRVQTSVDGMIRVVREDAQGIRVIKALSKTEHEHKRYDRVNRALVRDEKRASLTMGVVNPVITLLMNIGMALIVVVGANIALGNPIDEVTGNIIGFTQYFTMISMAMMSVTRIFISYTKSSASARRVGEVIDTPCDITLKSEDEFPRVDDGDYIVFDNVCFSYNGTKDNMKNINLSVRRGGTLGIIGSTGSGKTTLVNLLMRFYDVGSGSIRIGGRDIRTIPQSELHGMFGVALQNDFLYADTIEENIRFGRDITKEEIIRAAKIAQADGFINERENGYDCVLSQKGADISGGQKQRLLIARALAGTPDILILDDSSSALDYRTDAAVRRAISEEMKGTTSIVIAQRISSVMNSDIIAVLEDGCVIGIGTHSGLMEKCPVYREISDSQMGGAFVE